MVRHVAVLIDIGGRIKPAGCGGCHGICHGIVTGELRPLMWLMLVLGKVVLEVLLVLLVLGLVWVALGAGGLLHLLRCLLAILPLGCLVGIVL